MEVIMFKFDYLATVLFVMVSLMVICFVFASVCPTQVAEATATLAPLQDALEVIATVAQ
jgi:hypothetical protein